MKDGHFYQISGWMGNKLGLRGNELICFAIIYGFSLDGESQFKGNLNYLSDFMFCSKPTVMLCLRKLLELDLIRKEELMVNGKKRCYYSTTVVYDNGHLEYVESGETGKEPLPKTGKEPLPKTGKEPLPVNNNNKYNNNRDNNIKNKSNDLSKKAVQSSFLPPVVNEKEAQFQKAMKEQFPRVMAMKKPLTYEESQKLKDRFDDDLILSILMEMENWLPLHKKSVSAYLTIINWCNRRNEKKEHHEYGHKQAAQPADGD